MRMRVIRVVSVRQMRHQSINTNMHERLERIEKRRQVSERYAVTPHAGVYFEMNRDGLIALLRGVI